MRKHQKGFSLIELLIVITIILIIVFLAIPNIRNQQVVAKETAAMVALRTFMTCQTTYAAATNGGFAPDLESMGPHSKTGASTSCIDENFSKGSRQGYNFTYKPGAVDSSGRISTFEIFADPVVRGTTGQKSFFMDHTGDIRVNPTGPASSSDPVIQQ